VEKRGEAMEKEDSKTCLERNKDQIEGVKGKSADSRLAKPLRKEVYARILIC